MKWCPDCGHMLVFINEHLVFCGYCVKKWEVKYHKEKQHGK